MTYVVQYLGSDGQYHTVARYPTLTQALEHARRLTWARVVPIQAAARAVR